LAAPNISSPFEGRQNKASHLSPQRECLIQTVLSCHEIALDLEEIAFGSRQLCEIGLTDLTRGLNALQRKIADGVAR
jgi:hypothetical protein